MRIYKKENGTHPIDNVPLKLKKFFDMSKITTINLVLQRNGEKNCYLITYQRDTNSHSALG